MKRVLLIIGISLNVLTGLFAQSDQDKAYSLGLEAIQLMDKGEIDESIKLLKKAQKLDPERSDYPYELALAYYMKADYKTAAKILEKIRTYNDISDRLFQLLGNSYDIMGETDKAFDAYNAGLEIFPNSGCIYLEIGNVYWNRKEYGKALPYYEKGIEVQPEFPSNYYRAARLYCSSTEEVWGMIYGEIFMNL
ncbi:MAG: tetratricopeptide repeat protein, partial [Bacteroidota bacterium]